MTLNELTDLLNQFKSHGHKEIMAHAQSDNFEFTFASVDTATITNLDGYIALWYLCPRYRIKPDRGERKMTLNELTDLLNQFKDHAHKEIMVHARSANFVFTFAPDTVSITNLDDEIEIIFGDYNAPDNDSFPDTEVDAANDSY